MITKSTMLYLFNVCFFSGFHFVASSNVEPQKIATLYAMIHEKKQNKEVIYLQSKNGEMCAEKLRFNVQLSFDVSTWSGKWNENNENKIRST